MGKSLALDLLSLVEFLDKIESPNRTRKGTAIGIGSYQSTNQMPVRVVESSAPSQVSGFYFVFALLFLQYFSLVRAFLTFSLFNSFFFTPTLILKLQNLSPITEIKVHSQPIDNNLYTSLDFFIFACCPFITCF